MRLFIYSILFIYDWEIASPEDISEIISFEKYFIRFDSFSYEPVK